MRKGLLFVAALAFVATGATACATKKYVNTEVGQVSKKVDSLGQQVEANQQRIGQAEKRIGEVDQKAQAASGAAAQAQQAASAADNKAGSAMSRADEATAKADAVDKATKRIIYEVSLSEASGNFTFGKAELPDSAKAQLDELISKIMADPKGAYFEIEGHTDNVGDKTYNEKLGMERAEAVKMYLYEKYQIPLHRMSTVSYGEDKPVAPNTTKDGRAQNRRVVIRVLN
jgi:peptidoglycan-associated lipoprotein